MIRDRGRIKWAPFLIPEHKKRIAKLYEAEDDVQQPELDEQRLEELQEQISIALEDGSPIAATYYMNRRIHTTVNAKIKSVDLNLCILYLSPSKEETIKLPFRSILNIQICLPED